MKRALQSPIVVFVFSKNRGPKSTRFGGFVNRLKNAGLLTHCTPRVIALEDLTFSINGTMEATVTTLDGQPAIDDASLVYFKSWESMPEEAIALAEYAHAKGIPVMDEAIMNAGVLHTDVHKLSQLFRLWAAGVRVTPMTYSRSGELSLPADDMFVVKSVHGQKGHDNRLLPGQEVAAYTQDAKSPMVVQPYIPNDGDYRVLVYGHKVRGALYRQATAGSHLNNTSAGATSTFIPATELPKEIATLAIKAAQATKHNIAGVDVIIDRTTGQSYVLEVNQGSQIVTGHFVPEKMAAFDEFIHEALQSRYVRQTNNLTIIGRHVRVNLPDLGTSDILAKVDTGAYQSALNATDIRIADDELSFTTSYQTVDGRVVSKRLSVNEFDLVQVTNTSGIPQQRYRIKIVVELNGKRFRTPVTLVDRGSMKSPMLLGRRLLRGRFLVNPELSRKAYEAQL